MYTIEVMNYPVFCRLGFFPHERLVGQEILVSVEAVLCEGSDPAPQDDLDKTVDYAGILVVIDKVLKSAEIHLVETACDRVAKQLLVDYHSIDQIKVTVEKTLLPSGLAGNNQ